MPMKPFDPQNDGFGFPNTWSLDQVTSDQFSQKLAAAKDSAWKLMEQSRLLAPLGPVVRTTLDRLISQATTRRYGLCGGMAFAARDYWCAGAPLECVPGQVDSPSPELAAYLVRRMLDSLCPENLGRVLAWMAFLQLLPLGMGKRKLRALSRAEWDKLKVHVENDGPWPIALIRETSNPTENHQVLAFNCDPPGDKGALYVYDMNYPGAARRIELDFTGPALQAVEELPDQGHILWRGFFCEAYSSPPYDLPKLKVESH